jgi:hypothetical protein
VIEASAARWRKYGMDRLYVTTRDGSKLGWHDLATAQTHYDEPARAELMDSTVAQWRGKNGFGGAEPSALAAAAEDQLPRQPEPHTGRHRKALDLAQQEPGTGPRLREWELLGEQEQIECRAAALRELQKTLQQEDRALHDQDRALRSQTPLTSLRLWLRGQRSPERQGIAARREGIQRERTQLTEQATRAWNEVYRLSEEARPWHVGVEGEEVVARELAELSERDPRWNAIHSIPLGDGRGDIDHLVIGPAGVYTLNAKHHPDKRLFVYYEAMTVNGTRVDYIRKARWEAQRAARLLSSACRFPVRTSGLVVPVYTRDIVLKAQPRDVFVVPWFSLTDWLSAGPDELDETKISAIYEAARHESTWRR